MRPIACSWLPGFTCSLGDFGGLWSWAGGREETWAGPASVGMAAVSELTWVWAGSWWRGAQGSGRQAPGPGGLRWAVLGWPACSGNLLKWFPDSPERRSAAVEEYSRGRVSGDELRRV